MLKKYYKKIVEGFLIVFGFMMVIGFFSNSINFFTKEKVEVIKADHAGIYAKTIHGNGQIEYSRNFVFKADRDMVVSEIYLKDNRCFKKDEVLFSFVNKTDGVKAKALKMNALKLGKLDELHENEQKKYKLQIQAIENDLRLAKQKYNDSNELLKSGVISQSELNAIELEINKIELEKENLYSSQKQSQISYEENKEQLILETNNTDVTMGLNSNVFRVENQKVIANTEGKFVEMVKLGSALNKGDDIGSGKYNEEGSDITLKCQINEKDYLMLTDTKDITVKDQVGGIIGKGIINNDSFSIEGDYVKFNCKLVSREDNSKPVLVNQLLEIEIRSEFEIQDDSVYYALPLEAVRSSEWITSNSNCSIFYTVEEDGILGKNDTVSEMKGIRPVFVADKYLVFEGESILKDREFVKNVSGHISNGKQVNIWRKE